MVRESICKTFETYQPHKFVNFLSLFMQYSTRDQSRLDIAAHG